MSDAQPQLFDALKAAQNEMDGRTLQNWIWDLWIIAPDPTSQWLLDDARERIRYGDYDHAENILSELIDACPAYAEGWNQRAFARFLKQDYDRALDDIAMALELEPLHFGALAGRATTLINMGRTKAGISALKEAIAVNPWLSEPHLLPPGEDP
ncbi:tetratricopeptide repeat protein [Tateyamaria sp. SN6-1]|uniref:tetratricopeptide repeat protein n=1 Tax=Tateyamaria sp. SN6-1 TaxID=3092148 RepID=UPI0039F4697B